MLEHPLQAACGDVVFQTLIGIRVEQQIWTPDFSIMRGS
jgi:hypothetical protein